MIKETCAPPNVRYETLKQIVHIVQTNNAVCRAFGISTDPAGLKSLMGRVIDPLPLMYKDANGHRLAPTLTPNQVPGRGLCEVRAELGYPLLHSNPSPSPSPKP